MKTHTVLSYNLKLYWVSRHKVMINDFVMCTGSPLHEITLFHSASVHLRYLKYDKTKWRLVAKIIMWIQQQQNGRDNCRVNKFIDYLASMCHSEKMVANIYMIGKYYWTLVNLFIWGIRFSVTDLVCDDLVTYFVFDYRRPNRWILRLVKPICRFSHYFSCLVIFYAYKFLSTISIYKLSHKS
jgi:hypothetical protein